MGARVLRSRTDSAELRAGVAAIQQEQGVEPEFPAEVVKTAEQDAVRPQPPRPDRTDLDFVTIDPVGAMDLDQAMHLQRDGSGYLVHYAIADVMAFVEPGSPVDEEAHRRGESLYGAESKIPLHPPVLSEGAASLLPDQERPAFVWSIRLDAEGSVLDASVERARVRSRERLDYEGVQANASGAHEDSTIALLAEVGALRVRQEAERGGISLPMPEQEVDVADGHWRLEYRAMLPVENWNAQISLLTGFVAADMMVRAKVGVLRTLPPAPDDAVERLRRTARALGVDWPASVSAPDFLRALDPARPEDAAMAVAATSLLRGASYAAFDGQLPEQTEHAALASTYAHVTAPLRRLVDRYGLEICAALCAGEAVPEWVRAGLGELPEIMQRSGHKARAYENAVLDLVEAHTLQHRVGETFRGVVLESDERDRDKGTVMVREPAVEAPVSASAALPVGEDVSVVLSEADPTTRKVRFRLGDGAGAVS